MPQPLITLSSFRSRVFWSLIPVFLILFVFIGFVDFHRQSNLAEDEVRERAKSMAENLANAARLAVLTEDNWLLNAALQGVTGAVDFSYVIVYGERWKTLAKAHGQNSAMEGLDFVLTAQQQRQLVQNPQVGFLQLGGKQTETPRIYCAGYIDQDEHSV